METIKDEKLSILHTVFPSGEDHVFSVGVIAGFSLDSPEEIFEVARVTIEVSDLLRKQCSCF